MAREVTHDASGPRIVTPEDIDEEKGDVAICLCGLSGEYPFCDGSHRRTLDERDGVRYKYEDGGRRRVRVVDAEGRENVAHDGRSDPEDGGRSDPEDGGEGAPDDGGRSDPEDGGQSDPEDGAGGAPDDGGADGGA